MEAFVTVNIYFDQLQYQISSFFFSIKYVLHKDKKFETEQISPIQVAHIYLPNYVIVGLSPMGQWDR